MRALDLQEAATGPSKHQLFELANDFIEQGMTGHIKPAWAYADGSYNWKAAKNAHLAALDLPVLQRLGRDTDAALTRMHYAIWLEFEDQRLSGVIRDMEERRVEIRDQLLSIDLFGNSD